MSYILNDRRLLGLILARSRDYFPYSTDYTSPDCPTSLPPSTWPVFFTLEEQLIREADHSCQSSAAVKNAWICTSITPCVFTKWHLIRQSDKFKFTFIPKYSTLLKKAWLEKFLICIWEVNLSRISTRSQAKLGPLPNKHGVSNLKKPQTPPSKSILICYSPSTRRASLYCLQYYWN